jgi:hypothetical protein
LNVDKGIITFFLPARYKIISFLSYPFLSVQGLIGLSWRSASIVMTISPEASREAGMQCSSFAIIPSEPYSI